MNVFWRDCVPTESWEKNCYEASVNPEFGSTLARRLNQSCFLAVLQSSQITIKFNLAREKHDVWTGPKMDYEREFQVFGPKYKIINCMIFVRHRRGLQRPLILPLFHFSWSPQLRNLSIIRELWRACPRRAGNNNNFSNKKFGFAAIPQCGVNIQGHPTRI